MEHFDQPSLDEVTQNLLDKGILRPEQIRSWTFKELYLADPATLAPDMRRQQIAFRNSKEYAKFRIQYGLSDA